MGIERLVLPAVLPALIAGTVCTGAMLGAHAAHAGDGPGRLETRVAAASGGCTKAEIARDAIEPGRGRACTLRAAYRVNDAVAIEGIHESFDALGARSTPSNEGAESGDVEAEAFTVNGKLVASLGRLRSYLIGGIGLVRANRDLRIAGSRTETDAVDFAGRVGGGLDLRATERLSVFVDTAYTMGADAIGPARDFNLGCGARYRF